MSQDLGISGILYINIFWDISKQLLISSVSIALCSNAKQFFAYLRPTWHYRISLVQHLGFLAQNSSCLSSCGTESTQLYLVHIGLEAMLYLKTTFKYSWFIPRILPHLSQTSNLISKVYVSVPYMLVGALRIWPLKQFSSGFSVLLKSSCSMAPCIDRVTGGL